MLVDTGSVTADTAVFDAIQASLDELARMREQVVERPTRGPGARHHRAPADFQPSRRRRGRRGRRGSSATRPVPAAPAAADPVPPPPAPTAAVTPEEPPSASDTLIAKMNAELMLTDEDAGAAPEPAAAPAPSARTPATPLAAVSAPAAPAAEAGWSAASALSAPSPFARVRAEGEEALTPPAPVPPGREPVPGR